MACCNNNCGCNNCNRRSCCGTFDNSCICESPFCGCRNCGIISNQGIITGN